MGFWGHLGHLLLRSLGGAVQWMGTTLLAVTIGIVNHFWAKWFDRSREATLVKPWPKSIGFMVIAWVALVGASVIRTIYNDHNYLVDKASEYKQQSKTLRQQLDSKEGPKDKQLELLHEQLNQVCYRPDRHFTKAQHDALTVSLSSLAIKYKHPRIGFGMFWCAWKGSTCDYEAHFYVSDTQQLFTESGWNVISIPREFKEPITCGDPQPPGSPEGISITMETDADTREQRDRHDMAIAIVQAFNNAGVNMTPWSDWGTNGTTKEHYKEPLVFIGRRSAN